MNEESVMVKYKEPHQLSDCMRCDKEIGDRETFYETLTNKVSIINDEMIVHATKLHLTYCADCSKKLNIDKWLTKTRQINHIEVN